MHQTGQNTPESQLPPQHHETYNFNSFYLNCILWGPCPDYKPSNSSGPALYISFSLYFENTILTFKLVLGDGPYVSKFDFATSRLLLR